MKELPKAAFYTLGCKVNQNETEAVIALIQKQGYQIVDFPEMADLYVINTCTVTHLADRKSRQMIRKAIKANPKAKIVVMGCYSQMNPNEVENIPGVSLVMGTGEKHKVLEYLEKLKEKEEVVNVVKGVERLHSFEKYIPDKIINRSRAYIKIEDGCEQFCTYCIIPYARGPIRSRSLRDTLEEAQILADAGFKEVILTGIHLGAYGKDLEEGYNLDKLLAKLLESFPDVRWRLSSLEPIEVSDRLIELLATNENFCPHLHLPLQSGHNEILKAMNRPYTTEQYRNILEKIRRHRPEVGITTDVMVGFPGETASHFQAYMEFVSSMAFSGLHVFKYSPREGTPAAKFRQQVSFPVKEERSKALIELGQKLSCNYAAKFIGKVLNVLAEKKINDKGLWEGHSENYLQIKFFTDFDMERGLIVPVKVVKIEDNIIWGMSLKKGVC